MSGIKTLIIGDKTIGFIILRPEKSLIKPNKYTLYGLKLVMLYELKFNVLQA